jgi:hypothetical protein
MTRGVCLLNGKHAPDSPYAKECPVLRRQERENVTLNRHPATTLAGAPKLGGSPPEKSGTSNTVKRYSLAGGRPRKTAEEKRRTTRERVRRWRAA